MITPKTKIAELLNAWPELEDALAEISPAFRKLKNPVLRRTIARVTSLQQAAAIGEIPAEILINKLRAIAGQEFLDTGGQETITGEVAPGWIKQKPVVKSFDARDIIAQGGHPLGEVMGHLRQWEEAGMYELITPFLPAPLIDKVKEMGFDAWTKKESETLYRNYFIRPV